MKDTFQPPSMRDQNRLLSLSTNFTALTQSMVLEQLFWAQSFQHFLGSQGKNEASWEGLSKLNSENGKSQSMAGSADLVVMSYYSFEEAWRTALAWEHRRAWLNPPVSLNNSGTWLEAGAKAALGKLPTARALCLQGTTADLAVPATRLPPRLGASP